MPTKEYQILIKDKVVSCKYTLRDHKLMMDIYTEKGIYFTTRIRHLV